MELTPQAVSEAEFREAKRGGYNIRDVDEFLDRVAVGVGHMQERIREAHQRAEAAESRVVDLQRQLEEAQRRNAEGPGGDTEDTLRRTLVLAQRTADATIKEAKEEAERLLTEAREEAASTRAAAEAEARDGTAAARQRAEEEVQHLVSTRDDLAAQVRLLEEHVEAQRDRLRASVDDLQRVLDDPSALKVEAAPPGASPPDLQTPDLQTNGSVSPPPPRAAPPSPAPPPHGRSAVGGPPSAPVTPAPPGPESGGGEPLLGDPAVATPPGEGAAPTPDGPPAPSPERPPLPSRDRTRRSEVGSAPSAAGTDPEPEPRGFRPDMALSFDPSEDRGPRQGVPSQGGPGQGDPSQAPGASDHGVPGLAPPPGGEDELSLPIDAPPPPPPPPGLDHLRDVGGIPIEPGSRPSEWGKAIFDTEEDDEPSSSRFGRRG
jgi:DivIVA domain-containing protein